VVVRWSIWAMIIAQSQMVLLSIRVSGMLGTFVAIQTQLSPQTEIQ
jgi:hypothetical protein